MQATTVFAVVLALGLVSGKAGKNEKN